MAMHDTTVTSQQKEATAITVMRCMLLAYAEDRRISFEQALLEFAKSETYEALFDYETDIWKEGPAYLREFYEGELRRKPD